MGGLFAVERHDTEFYESRLRGFLPGEFVDIHAHVWLDAFRTGRAAEARGPSWPARVAGENPMEDLLETYALLFPGKRVTPLVFGFPGLHYDIDRENDYVAARCREAGAPGLALTMPGWSAEEFEQAVDRGGFLGCKPYLDYADARIAPQDITVYDFLPPHQLEVLDRRGWMTVLHLPRPGRLGDPVNLRQLLEIEQKSPSARVVLAHVGRAYCPGDAGRAFEALKGTRNLLFDFSANTNRQVFEQLLGAVGPRRVLFGSDLPILRMRAARVCEGGNYVNIVRRGAYGDVTGDVHMREAGGGEAAALTFLLYEQIEAFRLAAGSAGLGARDVEDVFRGNAQRLLASAGYQPHREDAT